MNEEIKLKLKNLNFNNINTNDIEKIFNVKNYDFFKLEINNLINDLTEVKLYFDKLYELVSNGIAFDEIMDDISRINMYSKEVEKQINILENFIKFIDNDSIKIIEVLGNLYKKFSKEV